ncbi:MAG: ABC transporter substrate-binding protein [Spirochaetaceae bacterium]|jgi:branched-chain amino acid transport system substrate-binding protein|nr:ABC transporter substrate-binding protein [Spirochaetaceae bacterium]
MKKITLKAAAALAAAALVLAGCQKKDAGNIIRIGYVGALSGDTSLWGQTGLNGLILTAEKVNAEGGVLGKQIEIIGLDGRGDPQDSVNALNKLIDDHKVVAVVGTNFSSCNIPMADIADRKQVPLIATAASNELVTVDKNGKLHPYSFRMCFIDSYQGTKLAEYALKRGIKRAALIVNQSDAYSTSLADYTENAFKSGGGIITAREGAGGTDTDFRAQLSKIATTDPEVLFVPWSYSPVAFISRQARELGTKFAFYGYDGWDSLELPAMAEGALEGALFSSRPGFVLPAARAYGDEYQKRFNMALEAECLFTNDALMWIIQAINKKGSAEPQTIRDGLEETESFTGLMGTMTLERATHNPQRELAIFEIRGNENVLKEIFK